MYFVSAIYYVLLQLRFITSSQYSDIVTERAVTKLCGYPLCGNTLTAVSGFI